MNQMQITDFEKFQEVINSLMVSYNKLLDIFHNQMKNVERINQTDVWSGQTAKVMYEKYRLLNGNYSHIEYSIDLYIKFLQKTLTDYKRLIEEMGKNLDEAQESLDVNS